ncbi:MAG: pilus assembly protein PilM [Planctomycetaceae bacterium]|nr:pilus assembly protein PilM [Planctomycetaceae bacterium]
MPKKQTVWGIDVGNSSLKALRCTLSDEPGKVEALACDFIEHSKVLTQPGTNPAETFAETLQTFLSRNTVIGDRIAISVSGQNTISRFLPLPPVDPKKIPDVIRYEAKQWLPFDIDDVVWDFQPLGPQNTEPGEILMDALVGMFAIKKDVAFKSIDPYISRNVDVDCIQSSPVALYNFVAYDLLPKPPAPENRGENPPQDSLVAICVGTNATDVIITDGIKVWTRNIPLGGNSFTKALTRELQLTFSKAEYLKRNIATSKDVDEQKRVVTAMRPVFNEMLNEVNRSLEYYLTINRKAKFSKIIALGNAVKLPGFRHFLSQNIGYEVVRLSRFNTLTGAEVTESHIFKENLPSFAACYGLALQQLGVASMRTNLMPREVITDRIIRDKKPWALAAAAVLMLGTTIQFAGTAVVHNNIANDAYKNAESKAKQVQTLSDGMKKKTADAVASFQKVNQFGQTLTSNVEGRIVWMEILRAIDASLPQSQPNAKGKGRDPKTEKDFIEQDKVYIESIEAVPVQSFAAWFQPLKDAKQYYPDDDEVIDPAKTDQDGKPLPPASDAERFERFKAKGPVDAAATAAEAAPVKRIVQITGYHYHNPIDNSDESGERYLRRTLIGRLKHGTVKLPPTLEEQLSGVGVKEVTMQDLGISYPTILNPQSIEFEEILNPALLPLPDFGGAVSAGPTGGRPPAGRPVSPRIPARGETKPSAPSGVVPQTSDGPKSAEDYAASKGLPLNITLRRFDFVIQFAWEETSPSKRKAKADAAPKAADPNTPAATPKK